MNQIKEERRLGRMHALFLSLTLLGMSSGCSGGAGSFDERTVGTSVEELESDEPIGPAAVACKKGSDCGSDMQCSDGICACIPGYVSCRGTCVDLANDPNHCGSCPTVCDKESCVEGVCGGTPTALPAGPIPKYSVADNGSLNAPEPRESALQSGLLSSVSAPIEVDGGGAATSCVWFSEAYPVRSVNAPAGDARWLLPFQDVLMPPDPIRYTWATNWNTWSSQQTIPKQWGFNDGGDSWSTSSSHTGLEYVSRVGSQLTGNNNKCIGIASTTWTNLQSGTWSGAMGCANAQHANPDDGPSIYYDDSVFNLYAAAKREHEYLYQWIGCNGQPNTGACPFTRAVDLGSSGDHPTLRTHPDHKIMVAFKDSGGTVHLVIVGTNGVILVDKVIRTGVTLSPVTACTQAPCAANGGQVPKCGGCTTNDCGNGSACMRVTDKVHLATRTSGTTTYAYLTYGFNCSATTTSAYLDVWDVSDPWNPFHVIDWNAGCGTSHNYFEPIFLAAKNTNKFAWGMYYQPNGDACNTHFAIWTTTDPAIGSWPGFNSVDTFPTMLANHQGFAGFGLGDYVGGADDTTGNLFFTYGRSTLITTPGVNCTACLAGQYSIPVYGIKATP